MSAIQVRRPGAAEAFAAPGDEETLRSSLLTGDVRLERPLVLHLIPSLARGGEEGQLVEFIGRTGHADRHVVAVFDEMGPLARSLPGGAIWIGPFDRRPSRYPGNVRTVRTLNKLVRSLGVDVVHAHLGVAEVLAALAVPRGVPIVASRVGRNVARGRHSVTLSNDLG